MGKKGRVARFRLPVFHPQISGITEASFEATEFPYLFLTAFVNKDTTIKRLMKGDSNASDVPGAVLQRSKST
ncbi:DNA methylase [Xanthomonas oryzae pv. oryzicola]|nr:DNA methylase [Xanthomonas oryzae pv. oryzicola]